MKPIPPPRAGFGPQFHDTIGRIVSLVSRPPRLPAVEGHDPLSTPPVVHRPLWRNARGAQRYVIAFLAVAIVALLRALAAPLVAPMAGYMIFTLAVFVAAAAGGVGPAVVATLLSGMTAYWLFRAQHPSVNHLDPLVVFVGVSAALSLLTERLARWRDRALTAATAWQAKAEELDRILDGVTDHGIAMLDPAGRVRRWNAGAERLSGWSADAAIGLTYATFFPLTQICVRKPEADLRAAVDGGTFHEVAWRRRADGTLFEADVQLTALRHRDGRLRGFVEVVRDVTRERAAARDLEMQRNHLTTVLEAVPDALVVVDRAGTIISFAVAAERLFGAAREAMIGKPIDVLLGGMRLPPGWFDPASPHQEPRRVIGCRHDGATFPMELTIGFAGSDDALMIIICCRDLTSREATAARMQQLQAELIHVSRLTAMGTMASILAHELNQPMTAIASYLGGCRTLLRDGVQDSAVLDAALLTATAEAMRAGLIVNRMREFIANGESSMAIERLTTLIEDSLTLSSASLKAAAISVAVDLPDAELTVIADRIQVQQVMQNLIRNAADAMTGRPTRSLRIECRCLSDEWVQIEIIDTGPGLPAGGGEGNLFEAFHSGKPGGLGLGLSICRTIVEAHGGTIVAVPADGGGACFAFTLRRHINDNRELADASVEPDDPRH